MKHIFLWNLQLNQLRGKTKASEMAMVIHELQEKHGTTIEEIEKRTGLKRDYIEKMLMVSRIYPEIMDALD
jgi:hypothetical protein